jgi:hypothetical protein
LILAFYFNVERGAAKSTDSVSFFLAYLLCGGDVGMRKNLTRTHPEQIDSF